MTEELKQAAQAALEQLEFLNACYPHKTATDASDALRRALTQRPAAQTEREAFEAEMRCEETWGHRSLKKRPDGRYQNWQVDVMWDVWQARASLPIAQQATPEQPSGFEGRVIVGHSKHRGGWFVYEECSPGEYDPIKGPFPSRESADAAMRDPNAPLIQQATPERHLTVTTNQQGEAVMVSWQDDEHRILDVVWERKPATPEPQTRFCPGCGSVGEVPDCFRDCCPDGAKARLIPTSLAHHCHDLFTLALGVAKESAALDDVQRDAERYRLLKSYDEHSEDIAICRWSDTGWAGEWVVEHDPDSIIDAAIQRRKDGGAQP